MEIIRRGIILPEEEVVANKISELPGSWWCIGGDSNRFTFKKNYGIQIDFLIISPKGVFLIDSKNISTIELSKGNRVRFYNSSGKEVRKKRENPVEEVLENKYNAKDWLRNRGIKELLTPDNKDLKVYIHGIVVISNSHNVTYKNCKLEQLNYYSHKYKTLIPVDELDRNFFDSIDLPPNCKELTQEEMWTLYKIFYNSDMTIPQIFSETKYEADSLIQEKYVFLEKVRILEGENLNLTKKINEFTGTRDNLLKMNQDLTSRTQSLEGQLNLLSKEIELFKEINKALNEKNIKYKSADYELKKSIDKTNNLTAKITILESENKKLKRRTEKQKIYNQLTIFKIISVILTILLGFWVIYFFVNIPYDNSIIKDYGAKELFYRIEKYYPVITRFYNDKEYEKAIKLWQGSVLAGNDFEPGDMHKYDLIFFYLAKSYQKGNYLDNAIKYYDVFTEISQNRNYKKLLEAYLNRSNIHKKRKDIHRAMGALKDAKALIKDIFKNSNERYLWEVRIHSEFARVYRVIASLSLTEQKDLKIKNPYELVMSSYNQAIKVASETKDYIAELNILLEIANMFLKDKKEYTEAIGKFDNVLTFIKNNKNNFDKASKTFVDKIKMTSYHSLGECFTNINNDSMAEQSYLTAIELSQSYQDKRYEAISRANLASLYKHLKKYTKARYQINKAYTIAKKLYDQKQLSKNYFDKYTDTYEQINKLYEANNK